MRAAVAATANRSPDNVKLDASRKPAEVLAFLRRSVRDFGQTVVMVTHDPVAAGYADRVLFLADGRIVEVATPADFFERPQSDRAKDFLSKILSH